MFTKKEKRKIARYSKFDKKNFLFVYLLIAIPVLQFIVFWVIVNIGSISLAFQTKAGDFTFQNFKDVWINFTQPGADGGVPKMILRSFILWGVSNLIAFPIALFTTYVLYKRVIGHYAFRVIFSLAGIVGAVVWVSILKNVLSGTSSGIVIYILRNWFGVQFDPKVLSDGLLGHASTAFPTIVIIGFIQGFVGGNVIVTGAYAKVPPELMEASKLDGLDFWGSFIHVVLPCSWPTISTLLTISLCGILVAEGNVFLYTDGKGGNATATMGYYLYNLSLEISKHPMTANYNFPAAIGVVISLISVPIVLIGRRIITKVIPTVEV